MSIKTPRKWRHTWEAQSHSPTLRLFLFDSYTKPSIQCKNLNVHLNSSQTQLLATWSKQGEKDNEEVSLKVPIPRVLIDVESPVSFKVLDDHIEVKLVLLLPVDHPIISSFDSVLNLSEGRGNVVEDTVTPLVMDYDLMSLSSMEEVHFYCRKCSTRLTSSPLRQFLEMPSVNWQEVADNWFGGCCCSFGGISEKLVARYANSYACEPGLCLLSVATVTLCKDDLAEFRLPDFNKTQEYQSEPDYTTNDKPSEVTINSETTKVRGSSCENQSDCTHDFESDDKSTGNFASENTRKVAAESTGNISAESTGNISAESTGTFVAENTRKVAAESNGNVYTESNSEVSQQELNGCSGHPTSHCCNGFDDNSTHDPSEVLIDQKIEKSWELVEDKKFFLNGFLGNIFMARSFNFSTDIIWNEFVCPHCSSLLGAYPCGNVDAPIDGGVRLFKCYISTSVPVGGSSDVFRKYTLERMFTSQLVESAQDELSFRTVVRDLSTKSPKLQVIVLNPDSWSCSGYCFIGEESTKESALKSNLHPVVKILFSDCNSSTESQLRMLEDWATKNSADEVFTMKSQIEELGEILAEANKLLPPSCYLQGLPVSSLQR